MCCITGILKKNEAELFKALSDVTKGHLENIVWGKKTKTHGLINKNGLKNGNSKLICSRHDKIDLQFVLVCIMCCIQYAHFIIQISV
jgi:hypothetical protein